MSCFTCRSADLPGIAFQYKTYAKDFVVVEDLGFEPSGQGEVLFLQVEKIGFTTKAVQRIIAKALGVESSALSYAGMKDKHAHTTQWFSVEGAKEPPNQGDWLLQEEAASIRIQSVARNEFRLKNGKPKGNRFSLRLRGVDQKRVKDLQEVVARIGDKGIPNYYGEQRFRGSVIEDARAWLSGKGRAPRDRQRRRFAVSALQAWIFNHYVAERLRRGWLDQTKIGDLVKIHESGGVFWIDEEADTKRGDNFEISATGPMPGKKMRSPRQDSEVADMENMVLDPLVEGINWRLAGKLAMGTRRAVRVPVEQIRCESDSGGVLLDFSLPAGSYATSLLREIHKGQGVDASAKEAKTG